jgi:pyrimidine-nucleoside phosphorylase
MYALRDVTGTVESIPLIASSIMSKKIAGGADALVLDVKCGHGAFMKNRRAAAALASAMISAGRRAGMRVAALITDMSQPLGTHVGNALEVSESIEILKGRTANDCSALSLELAAMMVLLGGRARDASSAGAMVRRAVESGRALEKFREMIIAQGGDHRVVDDHERLPRAPARIAVRARRAGFIKTVLAADIGTASVSLGAGRSRLDSELDHGAGIVLHKKAGDRVEKGDRLCTLHHDPDRTGRGAQEIEARALGAFVISSRKKSGPPVIIGRKGPR